MVDVESEWTEETCIKLIQEYRSRPLLWDPKDPFYFINKSKIKVWDDIGKILQKSPDECKHKMTVLLSSFRREKSRILYNINKEGADPSEIYKSTWFGFKELAFIMDKDRERQRQQAAKENGKESKEDENSENTNKNLIYVRVQPAPKKNFGRLHTRKRPRTVNNPKDSLPGPSQQSQKDVSQQEEEIKSFTTFIGNKMRKYTEATKNAVQQAICDIIFKADQNYFEKIQCDLSNNQSLDQDTDKESYEISDDDEEKFNIGVPLEMDDAIATKSRDSSGSKC